MKFRPLRAEEIELRVGSVQGDGATLLLYKDARADMNILDESVGIESWQKRYYEVKGNLYCSVGISINGEWIWKDDCGTESNTEKEKGEASDAFKRAMFNWGLGRELYTAPRIKVECKTNPTGNGNKYELADRWEFFGVEVQDIEYIDGKIAYIKISKNSKAIFEWDDNLNEPISKLQKQSLKQALENAEINIDEFLNAFNVKALGDLSKGNLVKANKQIQKKIDSRNKENINMPIENAKVGDLVDKD